MNICLFCHSFLPSVGGLEYVVHNLGNELSRQGHEVTVICKRLSWKKPSQDRRYQLLRYSLPIRGFSRLGVDFVTSVAHAALANLFASFDVIHGHGVSWSGSRARMISRITGIPLVLTPHGMDIQRVPELGYGLRLDDSWNRRTIRNLKSASLVTAISNSVRNELSMLAEDRIVSVPNGIHVEALSAERSTYLHDQFGIDGARTIILSVGRDHVVKGYNFGIQAIAHLIHGLGRKNVHYFIVGKGVTEKQSIVDACDIGSHVTLIDQVPAEKVIQFYKSSDIFFSPSVIEGFSLVGIEAMAAGLPLVVTNVPGNDDVVKENGCGLIVETKNIESMAKGLAELVDDREKRERFAAISEARVPQYDWSSIAQRYLAVYAKAIDGASDAAAAYGK